MNKSTTIEYCYLDYVPNVIEKEGVSIAVFVFDSSDMEKGMFAMCLVADWQSKVCKLDPCADLEILEALLTEVRERLFSEGQRSATMEQLESSFSNTLRISQRRTCQVIPSQVSIVEFTRGLLVSSCTAA